MCIDVILDFRKSKVKQVLHGHVDHDDRGEVEDHEEHPFTSVHQWKAQEHDANYSQCKFNLNMVVALLGQKQLILLTIS